MEKILHFVQVIVCFITLLISFSVIADKNPTGIPLGVSNYYGPPQPQGYYQPQRDQCDPASSAFEPDTTVTPGLNDGYPYYVCRYNFFGLVGQYFKANNSYFPCIVPELIGTIKVGEILHKELDTYKGFHQSVAAVFPTTSPNGKPNSHPFVVGLVDEGFIVLKNTSIPYDLRRNLQYHQAVQRKIELRKRDTRLYSESQVDQAKTLFSALTSLAEKSETDNFNFNLNRPAGQRLYDSPYISHVVQTFSTPTTRAEENNIEPDFIETEQVFGLAGARFEFQDPDKVSDKIFKLVNSSAIHKIDNGDLGDTVLTASANVLDMFSNYIELVQKSGFNFISNLHDHTEDIVRISVFNFTAPVPPIPVAYCNRVLEIDPRGHTPGGNMKNSQGMGSMMSGMG